MLTDILKKLFLILLIASPSFGLSVVQWYVDPDATGAADGTSWTDAYTTLEAFEAAEAKNLVTADEQFTVNCRSLSGGDDTTEAQFGGWTTDATRYIEIIGTDFPSDGILDTSKYILNITNPGGNNSCLSVPNYTRIRNLQVQLNHTDGGIYTGISLSGSSNCIVDSCIIPCVYTGSNYGFALVLDGGGHTVYNCVIYDWKTHASSRGITASGGTNVIYNTTVWNTGGAGFINFGTMTVKNCISALSPDDFGNFGSITIDYCASDDGDGTNSLDAVSGDWDNELTDANNGDFTIVASGNCENGGTDDPGSGAYSDDITGASRTSTWSVGAYEAPPSTGGQVISIIMTKVFKKEPLWLWW
jgi:hypothetical protein